MEDKFIEKEHKYIYQTYKRFPLVVDYAEGCYVYDVNGNKYLDLLAGIAVNALGHSHPKLIKAIAEQSAKYLHISNYFYQKPQIELAELICQISGYSKVFFSNSGTEANEGAIKLSRKWGFDKNKSEIIGFSGGFHGRTYGPLSVMDKPLYKINMGPYLPNTKVIEYNNIQSLNDNLNENTAAIILEFIQGEGGLSEPTPNFIEEINKLKNKYDFLIIADEIQCGAGRTGKMFGFEHFNIKPDIITVAKGFGGGLPLGAIIFDEKLTNVWEKSNHGTTYGGNALACATGRVVIDELQNGLLEQVEQNGKYFKDELMKLQQKFDKYIIEVRGKGLMIGLLLSFDASELVNLLFSKRIISNAASGRVLRLVPPLIISKEEIDIFLQNLENVLSNMNK